MAYTIISQNNSTTTLSDGVNTITVPSRVNLTSGNFTLVEVNNNMATLEDGDGNVYRDIPCVATLAGEGGGGGSGLPDQTGHSGEFLTTDGTDASWAAVNALPTQTGQSGKFLTTDGTDASWGTTIKPIAITPASLYYTNIVKVKGYNNNNDILYMSMTPPTGKFEIDIRNNTLTRTGWYYFDSAFYPHETMTNLTLGKSTNKWDNVYTTKINNGADITVPDVAGTMAVIQVNTTITLAAADWSGGSQTITVSGVTATGIVFVSPDPTDQSAYTSAGIICSAQAAGTLTFTCDTVPSGDLSVNVVML